MTYSQTISTHKNHVYKRNQNTYSFARSRARLGPVSMAVVVLALVCLMGMIYLSQVTRTNSLGYRISSLTVQEQELKKEKADLDIEAGRLQSVERLKASQVANAMTTVKPSAYAQ